MAGVVVLVALLVVLAPVAYATDYIVGDSQGWTTGVDYTTWLAGKTFKAGDTILFQYNFVHNVDQVSESDYNSCSSSNSIQTYTDQNTKISLTKPGTLYFICGTPGHCSNGQKLAVTVSAASTDDSPSATPSDSSPSSDSPPSNSPPSTDTTTSTKSSTNINGAHGSGGNAILNFVMLVMGLVGLLG